MNIQADAFGNNSTRFCDYLPTPKTAVKAGIGITAFLAVGAGIVVTLMGKKIIPIDLGNTSNVLIGTGSGLIGFGGLATGGLGLFTYLTRKSKTIVAAAPINYSQDDVRAFSLETFTDKIGLAKLQEFKRNHPNIPILVTEELGEDFSAGAMGHLFSATYEGKSIVYKLGNHHSGGVQRTVDSSGFLTSRNPEERMRWNLTEVINTIEFLEKIQNSPYFPRFLGIIYIKSKNQFGWAFEKIQGENLDDCTLGMMCNLAHVVKFEGDNAKNHFNERPKKLHERIQVMKDIAQGLQAMDQAGYSHNDLKLANLMIRYPEKRGVLVDHEGTDARLYNPEGCMANFGQVLENTLKISVNDKLPVGIENLISRCKNRDANLSWEDIINTLKAHQR